MNPEQMIQEIADALRIDFPEEVDRPESKWFYLIGYLQTLRTAIDYD
jgi:hypothetical protein